MEDDGHPRRGTRSRASLALALLLGISVAGCDETFEPIADGGQRFSVFGHLDPAADTQWIRVMPTRAQVLTPDDAPGVTVTLEAVGSGRRVVLRDSVFRFAASGQLGSEGVLVHNYWTTERIEPGESYRFTASGPSLGSATATVPIPSEFSASVRVRQAQTPNAPQLPVDELHVSGVPALAFVHVLVHLRDDCGTGIQALPHALLEESADPHVVQVSRVVGRPGCGPPTVEKRELAIVGSGSPWPSGLEFASDALGVPELPTNLTNAVGFLGGVLTKLVPYEECTFAGAPPYPEYCELVYDASVATLRGAVTDACTGRALADARVRLEALPADPGVRGRVRPALSGLSGAYRIGALEPGVRHALRVTRPPRTQIDPTYLERVDTLLFQPGEEVTLDLSMAREGGC